MPLETQLPPSLSDLLTQDAMRNAQLRQIGQEGQLRNLQMQQAQQGAQDTAQLRALLPQLMQSGDPQGTLKSLMMSGNPQAMEMAGKMAPILATMQKDTKTTWQDVGDKLVQLDITGKPTGMMMPKGAAPKEFQPSDIARLTSERDALPINDPRRRIYDQALIKATSHAPAPSAQVIMKQETEEAKTVGKGFGEQYIDIQKSGMNASNKIAKFDRMQNLLEGIDTGKLTPTTTQISAVADSLGVKIDKNLPAKQAALALSNEIALELRNPSGGAGMPGAMSDADRQFLVSMTPGIATTPGGNKLIIDTAKKLAKRDQEVANLARQYRMKNKTIDEGFYNELADFSAKNPLFTQQPSIQTSSARLPNPASLPNGAIVTDTVSGRKLIVQNGKYQAR